MLCKRKFKGCYGILISQWSDLKFAVNCLCVSSLKFSIWNCLPIIFDNFCAVLIGLLYRVLWWSNKWKLLGLSTFSSLSASAGLCSAANIWTIHDWSDVSRENTQAAARCAHCACLSSEQGGVCMRQRSARTLHNTQSWDYYALRARPVRLETSSVMTPMPFNPWYLDISSAHCFASTCDAPTYSQCGQQIDFGVETLLQTENNKARCDGSRCYVMVMVLPILWLVICFIGRGLAENHEVCHAPLMRYLKWRSRFVWIQFTMSDCLMPSWVTNDGWYSLLWAKDKNQNKIC